MALEYPPFATSVGIQKAAQNNPPLQAQQFVELLDPGSHAITSRMMQGGYNTKGENWNWFFAGQALSREQLATPIGGRG